MNTVIIIEGPDNIGKTKLTETIKRKFASRKHIVEHFGPNKTKVEGKKVFWNMITTLVNCDHKNFIFDRSPFGEFVYGKLYRGYDPFTYWKEAMEEMNNLLFTRFLFISLYADTLTYNQFNISSKKDEKVKYQKASEAEKVSVAFIELTNKLKVVKRMTRVIVNSNCYESLDDRNKYILSRIRAFYKKEDYELDIVHNYSNTIFNPDNMHINFTGLQFTDGHMGLCKDISKCKLGIDHCKYSEFGKNYAEQTTGCGNITNPRYIFVGEAPGYLGCGKYGVPFYGDKSGYLFYDTLTKLNILSSEIYVTNTIKCCPKNNDLGAYYNNADRLNLQCVKDLPEELTAIEGGEIIALGRVASNTLKSVSIPHKMVYHPAYYLRIGANNKFEEALREVIC